MCAMPQVGHDSCWVLQMASITIQCSPMPMLHTAVPGDAFKKRVSMFHKTKRLALQRTCHAADLFVNYPGTT